MLLRVFSRAWIAKDYADIDPKIYSFDYLALDAQQVAVPKMLIASTGDFVTFGKYDGLIMAVDKSVKGITTFTVKPLMELLNISAYRPREYLYNQPMENFFGEWIADEFIHNSDPVQNIEGMTVEILSSTGGAKLNLVDDVNNIYEIAVKALLKYRMVINMQILPQEKKLVCTIGVNTTAPDYIRLDQKNIITKKIVLQDSIGACNKLTAVDANGLERNMVYYADGYDVPSLPATELIIAGSKESYKIGTKYSWLYLPFRPKTPSSTTYMDATFASSVSILVAGTISAIQDMPMIYVIISSGEYYVYPFEIFVAEGYTFTTGNWHQYKNGAFRLCPDGYPSTGLDDAGKPGIFIDSEMTAATRIDLLGDYIATKPIEFYDRAVERTYELFKPDGTNNLIEITTPNIDGLMPPIEIGREDNIINEGDEIPSVLTGWRVDGNKVTRIYGGVRMELTKKLKLERR